MIKPRWFCLFAFCLSLSAQVIDVSKLPGTAPAANSTAAANRRIELAVVVTDKSGKPVSGLQQQDFTLVDNKKPQKIVSFQAAQGSTADEPIETVLLVDMVNHPFTNVAVEREELKKFLRANGGKLDQPMSVIFFSDTGTSMEGPTRDGNAVIAALDRNEIGLRSVGRSQGVYGAMDRFQMSIEALISISAFEVQKPGRKMLIWLGPGWPLLNGPNMQLTQREEQGLFNSIVTVSTALRESRITLYSLDPLVDFYQYFRKGVSSPRGVVPGNLTLQVIAEQSGGRVIHSGSDIPARVANCLVDANAWYLLSFDYPPADGPAEYHSLEVKMGTRGLTARTRTGYYAQP